MTEYRDGRVFLQTLSHSRVAVSRDCPAKYGYRYVDGLRAKVEKDPTRLRGRGMHEGLAAGYQKWRDLRLAVTDPRLGSSTCVDLGIAPVELIRTAALEMALFKHKNALALLDDARQKGAPVEVCDEVHEKLVETYEADSWALGHFFDIVVPRDYARKTPILIEHEFDVPLLDVRGAARHLRWVGYLDCVMYDEKLRVIELHEQKTVGTNAGSDEHRRRIEGDPQTTSYIYALRSLQKTGQLGTAMLAATGLFGAQTREIPVGTVIVNVIRRKKPSEPKTLADGTVSADRRIDTLPEIYEAALEAQTSEPLAVVKAREACQAATDEHERASVDDEMTPKKVAQLRARFEKAYEALGKKREAFEATQAKQRELLAALRERGDTFIAEHEQFVTERECERWRSEQWVETERMRRIEKRPAERTRNLGFCTAPGRGCTFRTLCYSGGDEQIRAMEFTTPEERERMAAEATEKEEQAEEPAVYDAPAWG